MPAIHHDLRRATDRGPQAQKSRQRFRPDGSYVAPCGASIGVSAATFFLACLAAMELKGVVFE